MKQFVVIGLGNFGKYLSTHLYEKGHEVLAVDKRPGPVQDIKDQVTRAVVGDATDRRTWSPSISARWTWPSSPSDRS